jgi:parallel beta-helix repeat protein
VNCKEIGWILKGKASFILLILLFSNIFALAINALPVKASVPTIYINDDGSISPNGAPIVTFDNTTYNFTGDISYPVYNGIEVDRSNIVLNGGGYTLAGNGGIGINLMGILSNVSITRALISGFYEGVYILSSSEVTISENSLTSNTYGIYLDTSSWNSISQNNLTYNYYAIYLFSSSRNTITKNNVTASYSVGIDLDYSSSYNAITLNIVTSNSYCGLYLYHSSNFNGIYGNNIIQNGYGCWCESSSKTSISGNKITGNSEGIYTDSSSCMISGNNLASNGDGMDLDYSNATVFGNFVNKNGYGVYIYYSNSDLRGNNVSASTYDNIYLWNSNVTLCHNNFIKSTAQVYLVGSLCSWNDSYPSGGNYWSEYIGSDSFKGPYQNVIGSDGIGDLPYMIDASNVDHYPLYNDSAPAYWHLTGDINYNGKVSLQDLAILAFAYNSVPGSGKWNPVADLDGNGAVGLSDLVILAKNYNNHYP